MAIKSIPAKRRDSVIAIAATLLLAAFPLLALHSFNVQYLHYSAVLRALSLSLLGTAILVLLFSALLRNWQRGASLASLFIILFFIYGHVFLLLANLLGRELPNLLLSAIWLILFVLLGWLLLNKLPSLSSLNNFLLLVAGLLVIFNLGRIASFELDKAQANRDSLAAAAARSPLAPDLPISAYPDIYYIILDAHARSDVLQTRFGHDNSPFINALTDLGFYVAQCSQANYWRTEFSVGSAFRMDYFGPEFRQADALPDWQFSPVFQFVQDLGYQIVSFETRATHNQDLGQDILLSRRSQTLLYENIYPFANLNDFEANLLKTTWLQSWLQLIANQSELLPAGLVLDADNAAYLEHYRQTLYVLDELPRVPYLDSPKFVYVHFLVPHEPFVFDASGRFHYRHTQDEFEDGYRNNVEFIDAQLTPVLRQIIANSAVPPIIIVQGDHGPNGSLPETLLPILNAYYFPSGGNAELYDHISPVNSFPTLFNYYFGQEFALHDDTSFYARGTNLAEAEQIGNDCEQQ
jgi:hypothetical protein